MVEVTLDFLARQQAQILSEMAAFRDDIRLLTQIAMRQEANISSLATQFGTMYLQIQRFGDRIRALESAAP
jgi:hypothetical protein